MKLTTPEKVIQLQILKYLKLIGATAGKTKTMATQGFRSDPLTFRGKCDLEAFKDGVMYGIEVKSKKGRLSPEQILYKELFHKPPDRIYILARSVEDVSIIIS